MCGVLFGVRCTTNQEKRKKKNYWWIKNHLESDQMKRKDKSNKHIRKFWILENSVTNWNNSIHSFVYRQHTNYASKELTEKIILPFAMIQQKISNMKRDFWFVFIFVLPQFHLCQSELHSDKTKDDAIYTDWMHKKCRCVFHRIDFYLS